MSMIDIKPETVRSRAREIEALRENDMEILGKIRALVFTLEETWKGQAQEALVNKYLSQQSSITELFNSLLEYAGLLKDAADRADGIDSELVTAVNRILVD